MFSGKFAILALTMASLYLVMPAHAQMGSAETAAQAIERVQQTFDCTNIKETPGFFTCETAFDFKRDHGVIPVDVTVRANTSSGGVREYKLLIRRPLIRFDTYEVFAGFSAFVDRPFGQSIVSQDHMRAYLSGRKQFLYNGISAEVTEFSDKTEFSITAEENASLLADAGPVCPFIYSADGWEVTWSKRRAWAEPSLRQAGSDIWISGKFVINEDKVRPVFGLHNVVAEKFLSHRDPASLYISVLTDGQLAMQRQWIKKTEPTCCSTTINEGIPFSEFYLLADAKEGKIVLSRDSEMNNRVGEAGFDAAGLLKALMFADSSRKSEQKLPAGKGCR